MRGGTSELHGPRRIALAISGTAGHITPALAVAQAYRAVRADVSVLLVGSTSGWERGLVAAGGHHFEDVPAAPLYGVSAGGRARAVTQLAAGIRYARRVLRRHRVQLVVGFGGYASAGAVLAARSLGLATVVHEANARPGLSNRLLARVADRVLVAWPGTLPRLPFERRRHTGTPIRADLAALVAMPPRAPGPAPYRLLVCGGSQGSPFLNRQAPALAGWLQHAGAAVEVRHLSGREPPSAIASAYAAQGIAAEVRGHADDMAAAYRWAALALTAAGAVSLAEIAAAALPPLLVPLGTASGDHQRDNAVGFAAATGAPWVPEPDWNTGAVGCKLVALLRDCAAWQALSRRVGGLARPDAAAAVVRECEALLEAVAAGRR